MCIRDSHDVRALHDLALERARVDELGEDVRGAEVREDAKAGAEPEKALLGALLGGERVPLVPERPNGGTSEEDEARETERSARRSRTRRPPETEEPGKRRRC